MLELLLPTARGRATHVLCLGAHCDDIEIGCGGTLLKFLSRASRCDVTWVVLSSTTSRERELRSSARRFLRRAAKARVIAHQFSDTLFPAEYPALKGAFAALRSLPPVDLIFSHHRGDLHQDHRLVGELTWNTFRRHLILEYEIPKYEGGLTTPNAYVQLSRNQAMAKIRTLLASYASQRNKPWFRAEVFSALMRLRAVEAGTADGWAEGFHAAKLRLG
jgi:LmbE family N-acetylglucosaminyl deacetylase